MSSIIVFLILLQAGNGKTPQAVVSPAPSLTVSFERQNVREQDCVNVEVLISNQSELELINASLDVTGPSFLNWYCGRCESKVPNESRQTFDHPTKIPPLSLGSISARSHLRRELHFRSSDTIEVGEYNLLLTVPYEWKSTTVVARSFVSAEKSIKVSFLGSESIAGIPLGLAGFIVPGLLFWVLIGAFGASWSKKALGDELIYSVIVSTALVILGSWLGFWDVSAGISIEKLTMLAGTGAALGLAVGLGDYWFRSWRRKKERERRIKWGENEASLLGKMLELSEAERLDRPIIELKEGGTFAGSLGALTAIPREEGAPAEVIYSLVGSFNIVWDRVKDADKERLMRTHIGNRQMRKLMDIAAQTHALEPVRLIEKKKGAEFEATEDTFKQWKSSEVKEHHTGSETWNTETLDTK